MEWLRPDRGDPQRNDVAVLRKTWLRFVKELKRGRVFVDLGADGGGTIGTKIFVLVPFRQDKEQLLSHGNGGLTLSAIQRRCLKFLEAGFLHIKNYKKKSLRPQPFIVMKSSASFDR